MYSEWMGLIGLFLIVRVGQMLLIAGSVRSKNAAGVCVRLLLDVAVVGLVLWGVGGLFVGGSSGDLIVWSNGLGMGDTSTLAWFQLPLILLATAAIHGSTVERVRTLPVLLTSGLLAAVIPMMLRFLSWGGWNVNETGLVLTIGGASALVGTMMVGARKGKFNRDLSANFVPGHHLVFQLLGIMVLMGAFSGISPRSTGVLICTCSAILTAGAFGKVKFGKIDPGLLLAGTLGGMCTGSSGSGPDWLAFLVGIGIGVLVPWLVMLLEVRFWLDDPIGAIPTHLVGGAVGLWVGGVVDWVKSGWSLGRGIEALMLPVICILVGALVSGSMFYVFKRMNGLRLSESAEFDGIDLFELDVNAYPDFQQTMIKSYHLREL